MYVLVLSMLSRIFQCTSADFVFLKDVFWEVEGYTTSLLRGKETKER